MAKRIVPEEVIGKTFGQLTIRRFWIDEKSRNIAEVDCACGSILVIRFVKLYGKAGKKSCGCLRGKGGRHYEATHGDTGSTEYGIWLHIKKRCYNPNDAAYELYGARGITVCERWLNSYEAFLADVGRRPTLDHQLERRDNNLGYSSDNCYWATRIQQGNNRRTNHVLEFGGRQQTITQWARERGLSKITMRGRLARGWSVERALTVPAIQDEVTPRACPKCGKACESTRAAVQCCKSDWRRIPQTWKKT